MTKRILHIVTNVARYEGMDYPTGLWLGELTHAYDEFEKMNYRQDIASPLGGQVPLDPKSLGMLVMDDSIRARKDNPAFMQLLENSLKASEVNWQDYDAMYYTGGHGVMWDFLNDASLQDISRQLYEHGGIVASVCHGYCGLLNIRLSDGTRLIEGKKLTGFSWIEEVLAGVAKKVPYNAEALAKQYGAQFEKALIPFAPFVVTDGKLITGQNPFSAKLTAQAVIKVLENG